MVYFRQNSSLHGHCFNPTLRSFFSFSPQRNKASFSLSLVHKLMILPITDIKNENIRQIDTKCNGGVFKVFMYDLPDNFHFDILNWHITKSEIWPKIKNISTIPSYPGGLNRQHSVEYWLRVDLLASEIHVIQRPCSTIRVENSIEVDIVYMPFSASLSYNRKYKIHGNDTLSVDRMLQERLVEFLKSLSQWKRFDGKDHLIVAHHPNSLLNARNSLGSAMFVLSDFRRYPSTVPNLEQDIIAFYAHVVKTISNNESAPFEKCPILAYFQGAIFTKDASVFVFFDIPL